MISQMRKLMFLLVVCAFLLLLVDHVVYLSPRFNSYRRNDGYSVRRIAKDDGSRWTYDNSTTVSGTVTVPINKINSSNSSYPKYSSNNDSYYYNYNDSYNSNNTGNNDSYYNEWTLQSSQKLFNLLDKNAVVKNSPRSVKNSSHDSHPPTSGNIWPAHKSEAKKPSSWKTKLAAVSKQLKPKQNRKPVKTKLTSRSKQVQSNQDIRPMIRNEYMNPNMSCTVGKSRERMLNSFGTKFNSSLPAFVDEKFSDIPDISKYPPPFGFSNSSSAVVELLQHLPETGLPKELQNKTCLRCVVVGNGGILKRSSLGSVIDNFDVIIRMNSAPTKGYERDVGAKTTIRISYPEGAPKKEKDYAGKPWLFIMMAFKTSDLKWMQCMAKGDKLNKTLKFWVQPAQKIPKPASDFRLLNAAIVKETAFDIIGLNPNNGTMRGNCPTTGTISIMLGLRLCDEVAIAGFGYDLNAPKAPMHYYDNLKMSHMKKSWTHNIDLEKKMLLKLVRQGIIMDLTGGIR